MSDAVAAASSSCWAASGLPKAAHSRPTRRTCRLVLPACRVGQISLAPPFPAGGLDVSYGPPRRTGHVGWKGRRVDRLERGRGSCGRGVLDGFRHGVGRPAERLRIAPGTGHVVAPVAVRHVLTLRQGPRERRGPREAKSNPSDREAAGQVSQHSEAHAARTTPATANPALRFRTGSQMRPRVAATSP